MPPTEVVQFGEKVANLHRCRIKDTPGSGRPPALCYGQATVKRLADHVSDRCTALACDRANPLVTLIVDENLQPMRQHTHTLACTYGVLWTALRPCPHVALGVDGQAGVERHGIRQGGDLHPGREADLDRGW
jgi:hypothetical protein